MHVAGGTKYKRKGFIIEEQYYVSLNFYKLKKSLNSTRNPFCLLCFLRVWPRSMNILMEILGMPFDIYMKRLNLILNLNYIQTI